MNKTGEIIHHGKPWMDVSNADRLLDGWISIFDRLAHGMRNEIKPNKQATMRNMLPGDETMEKRRKGTNT